VYKRQRVEREFVVQALQKTRGNQTAAGRLLGMSRYQLRYRIEKFGLDALTADRRTD
jgi:two-component system response regulator PilR (NtrC family)